ncbi:MAG: hypothetical protein ACI88H_000786, partial [Cocleimonas sp.]
MQPQITDYFLRTSSTSSIRPYALAAFESIKLSR